ncbi:ATPase AAA [Clostridia bacterium]|nr:ATPase AAA [Clostridia bacterium]
MNQNVESLYLDRLIDPAIETALSTAGCVVIEGPKWCGKSTTAKRFAKTVVELAKPSTYRQYKLYADFGDDELLRGEKPLLFDEWQKIPDLWDYIRAEIDSKSGQRGQYILTGSARPVENGGKDNKRHSGTGRILKVVMRPMSLWESKDSTGEVSLSDLFDGATRAGGRQKQTIRETAYLLCRGGWPETVIERDKDKALLLSAKYVSSLIETDIVELDDIKRNPTRARAILRSYARNISAPAKLTTLQQDLEVNDSALDTRTLDSYINAFKKLFVIEDIEAWSPKLRSSTALRTADTRQFVDPAIAAAVLGAKPDDLISDLNTFGLLFESMCIRDLRVYAERLNGNVFNYRDKTGLEADAIIHLDNGKWAAIEVKLGSDDAIEQGAKHLLELKGRVDTEKMKQPSFLMVMTASPYAYRRPDGVYVVPIGCLKD